MAVSEGERKIISLLQQMASDTRAIRYYLQPRDLRAKVIVFKTSIDGQNEGVENVKNLEINENGVISIKGFLDAKGNKAEVEGNKVAFSLVAGSEALGELQVADDGMSAKFLRNGAVGVAQVNMVADADLSEGVQEIFGTAEFNCLSGKAVKIDFEEGAEAQG